MSRYPLAERPYETIFICPPETPQATIDAFVEKLKAIIVKENGVFKSVQVWGRRRMTFPIKRNKDGLYIYIDFNAPSTVPALLNQLFRVTDFIMRQMTVERVEAPAVSTPAAAVATDGTAVPAATPAETPSSEPVNQGASLKA